LKSGEELGRLKFRTEGEFQNVYYEEKDVEPVFLGGVALILLDDAGRRQQQFLSWIQDCFADLVKRKHGVIVDFDTQIVLGKTNEVRD
jgi:hypothetical protein